MHSLKGKTYIVTGASRGIGKAIALRLAKDGANVTVAAKTIESTPQRPGTIYEAADEVTAAGGQGLAVQVDVRDEAQIKAVVDQTVERFGGLDGVINNAGAIQLTPVEHTPVKRYDLMLDINLRASFAFSHYAIPHLKASENGHIMTLSPPMDLDVKWFSGFAPYTISKFGMSMLVLGLSEELRSVGVAANALWPRTAVATAAIAMLGGEEMMRRSRTTDVMADAAHVILTSDARECTGNHFIDEDVLRAHGVTDFAKYAVDPTMEQVPDLFVQGTPIV
jgi:citronellol/citronellal dehydrogenase